jgi:hypothetical protein
VKLESYIKEEHKLSVLESRMIRGIFAPGRQEGTEDCRLLHKEHHNLYSSPNVIRAIKSRIWAGHVACMETDKGIQILV